MNTNRRRSQRESNWINPVRMGIYLSRVVLVSNADAIPPDGKTTGDRTQRKVDGNQANPQAAQSKSARRGMPSGPQSWAPPMEKNDHPHQPQPKFSPSQPTLKIVYGLGCGKQVGGVGGREELKGMRRTTSGASHTRRRSTG